MKKLFIVLRMTAAVLCFAKLKCTHIYLSLTKKYSHEIFKTNFSYGHVCCFYLAFLHATGFSDLKDKNCTDISSTKLRRG